MAGHFDTIFAPITAPGRAAVAVIRVSGSLAFEVVRGVFAGLPNEPESHRAYFGQFSTGDEGLALAFAEGRGYTGDPSVELTVHGSPVAVGLLLDALERQGARPAEPGEFTRRAFLNGRLDLTQAEAVRDTVDAETDAQFRAANRVRQGHLHARLANAMAPAKDVLVAIEASVDFSEEIGFLDRAAALPKLQRSLAAFQTLLETAAWGRLSREGAVVALVGAPNAGKSSLLNALLGRDRALVTPVAGTTRDTVEEMTEIEGVPCRLIDTAGLRETADLVEGLGIERSRDASRGADLILYVVDAQLGLSPEDHQEIRRLTSPHLVVMNKVDLVPGQTGVSATTGAGLLDLRHAIRLALAGQANASDVAINARHQPLLERAIAGVQLAIDCLESDQPDDLASVALRDALFAVGEITGEHASADILDRIFHDFCIGK
ncbi:MAG: tRNA uridine-5-carboxymethylaminomethyl(34) synthesis GTPase MnmE [Chthonomonas sp.]|nr:tRNA uridine-5-carboxymethylaminomethyl(34) synthesis GTPase MnmE [Chthonomonas sp.]